MRDLTNIETEIVSGGLLDICVGDLTVGNGISLLNGNAVASGNDVSVKGNASGNDVSAKVKALLSAVDL